MVPEYQCSQWYVYLAVRRNTWSSSERCSLGRRPLCAWKLRLPTLIKIVNHVDCQLDAPAQCRPKAWQKWYLRPISALFEPFNYTNLLPKEYLRVPVILRLLNSNRRTLDIPKMLPKTEESLFPAFQMYDCTDRSSLDLRDSLTCLWKLRNWLQAKLRAS